MYIKVKKLDKNAVMPKKAYNDDFCYDVTAISVEEIAPKVYKYHTGLAFQMVDCERSSEYDYSIDLRPRSSICKTGMVGQILSNGEGTVDKGYTGEVTAVYYHVIDSLPIYKVGDRIAQIKVGIAPKVNFVEADELAETDRSSNGYGSSGR